MGGSGSGSISRGLGAGGGDGGSASSEILATGLLSSEPVSEGVSGTIFRVSEKKREAGATSVVAGAGVSRR